MLGILLRSWLYFALRDWRERYPGVLSLAAEVFGLALSLAVYWYTARAFSGHADFAGGDYFGYVVLGEASLMIPLGLVGGLLRAAREAQAEGVLEPMLTLPWSGVRTALLLGATGVAREATRAVALLTAAFALGVPMPAAGLAGWILLQSVGLPVFAALGILATACYLKFGRGEGVVAYLGTIAAVLAGTYFPVGLFPEALGSVASLLSPFNVLLEGARQAFAVPGLAVQWPAIERLGAMGLLLLPLSVLAFGASLRAVRDRGSVELTT